MTEEQTKELLKIKEAQAHLNYIGAWLLEKKNENWSLADEVDHLVSLLDQDQQELQEQYIQFLEGIVGIQS